MLVARMRSRDSGKSVYSSLPKGQRGRLAEGSLNKHVRHPQSVSLVEAR